MTSSRFRVLVVCTGNICRSPMGELLLRDGLDSIGGTGAASVHVGSAGTYSGHAGEPMQPGAAAALRERGIDPQAFRATALTSGLVDQADLVLTAERSHRAAVVRLVPAAVQRTFTVVEFGRLVSASGGIAPSSVASSARSMAESCAQLLASAARMRGVAPPPHDPGDDDIADPYGMPVSEFRACAVRLDDAFAPMLSALSGRG